MIEMMETMMPSTSIDLSTALLIISICALVDILSPGVLAVTAYLLLIQPNQLSSRLLIFLSTTQLGYFIMGFFLYFGGDSLLKRLERLSEFDFINWFYILFGAVLVLISFIKPKDSIKTRLISFIPKRTTVKGMIALGLIVFLFEFVTALPYIYAILLMKHLAIGPPPSLFIIMGYNLVMVVPSLLLLGVQIVFKKRLQQFLNKTRSKLNELPISSLLVAIGVVGAVFFNIGLRGILK